MSVPYKLNGISFKYGQYRHFVTGKTGKGWGNGNYGNTVVTNSNGSTIIWKKSELRKLLKTVPFRRDLKYES